MTNIRNRFLTRQRAVLPGVPTNAEELKTKYGDLASVEKIKRLQDWANRNAFVCQGFRIETQPGETPSKLELNSPADWLVGVSVSTQTQDANDVRDVTFTLQVNNFQLLSEVSMPTVVRGNGLTDQLYFPVVYPMGQNDNINTIIDRVNGGSTPNYIHIYYIPLEKRQV